MSSNILEVKNLHTYFGQGEEEVQAVKNVSFLLKKGSTLGIVGESGSGKSVTSLSILRLIDKPPGEIKNGEVIYHHNGSSTDLLKLTEKELRHFRGNELSMIFQEPMTSLNPVFRCGAQVQEALHVHTDLSKTEAKQKVLHLFKEVQLRDPERVYQSYPHEISGGQKQRVMIAMALACGPRIMIADEPTTALDVTVQKAILDLLKSSKAENDLSLIFISHDLGVIAEIADQVAVMYKGEIVECASVENIFKNPQHPYTKGLIACRPPLDFKTKRLKVIDDFLEKPEEGLSSNAFKPIGNEEIQLRKKFIENSPVVLDVKELHTWYPSKKDWFGRPKEFVKAVNGVSFNVKKGETLGLVGESGCGKTTLGRTLVLLENARSGSAHYEGKNILELERSSIKAFRKKVQIIFQDPYSSLNPRMQIGKAIQEPMQVHELYNNDQARKEKVVDLLGEVGLNADHYTRYPHQFSGGQRQRICIARALSLNPEFIICDESVSALDVSVQAKVLNLLLDLQEKHGLTYIFISHDLSVVKFMSDRLMVMQAGKIVERGWSGDIYDNPQNKYTQRLIEAIPKGFAQ